MNQDILQQDNTDRIRTIQGARFLFVVFIYISHCVTPNTTQPFDFGGEFGVSFFFVLSGFVLSWGYGPRISRGEFRPMQFFRRHFWHLYPLHLLLFAIVLTLDLRIGHHYDLWQIVTSLLLVQSWIPWNHTLYTVNAVSWFLCDVIFFYAIFKWLYGVIMRWQGHKWLSVVFVVAYCLVAWNVPKDMVNCTLYANPLLRTVDFSLGIAAYRLYKTGRLGSHWLGKAPVQLPVWVLAFLLLYGVYQGFNGNGVRCAALFWPFMPLFIVSLVSVDARRDPVARLLASRPAMWLGGISFEFFMVHLLAMRLTQHFIDVEGTPGGDMQYFCVSFVVAIALAWLLHNWFVKPVGDAINRCFSRS